MRQRWKAFKLTYVCGNLASVNPWISDNWDISCYTWCPSEVNYKVFVFTFARHNEKVKIFPLIKFCSPCNGACYKTFPPAFFGIEIQLSLLSFSCFTVGLACFTLWPSTPPTLWTWGPKTPERSPFGPLDLDWLRSPFGPVAISSGFPFHLGSSVVFADTWVAAILRLDVLGGQRGPGRQFTPLLLLPAPLLTCTWPTFSHLLGLFGTKMGQMYVELLPW